MLKATMIKMGRTLSLLLVTLGLQITGNNAEFSCGTGQTQVQTAWLFRDGIICSDLIGLPPDPSNMIYRSECANWLGVQVPPNVADAFLAPCHNMGNGTAKYRAHICCYGVVNDPLRCFTCNDQPVQRDDNTRSDHTERCNHLGDGTCGSGEVCQTTFHFTGTSRSNTVRTVSKSCAARSQCETLNNQNSATCQDFIEDPSCTYCCNQNHCNYDSFIPNRWAGTTTPRPSTTTTTRAPTPPPTACSPNPCRNGGTCHYNDTVPSGFVCDCQPGRFGSTCSGSNCSPSPCRNRGRCTITQTPPFFRCHSCPLPYEGQNCSQVAQECTDQSFCLNGGTCYDYDADGIRCLCQEGFVGTQCEMQRPIRCSRPELYFTFSETTDTWNVNVNCTQRDADQRSQITSTSHLSTCRSHMSSSFTPGRDGDEVTQIESIHLGSCRRGVDITHQRREMCCPACFSSPCQNGGWCISDYIRGGYICRCRFGFEGHHCQTRVSICSIVGDPHYRTFDTKLIHFQGACRYKLAQPDEEEPEYTIFTKNEHRNGNTDVSYIKYIEVCILSPNICVRLSRNNIVFVDGVQTSNELQYPGLRVRRVRWNYLRMSTDRGVVIEYDGDMVATVRVPTGPMIGLCGNNDGNPFNDLITRNGRDVSGEENGHALFGDSWQVNDPDDPECTLDVDNKIPECKAGDLQRVEDLCGIIKDSNGPFGQCVSSATTNAELFFETCVYDVCASGADIERGSPEYCATLQSLVLECEHVSRIRNWREEAGCVMECPGNMTYSPDTSACQPTCLNPDAVRLCEFPNNEGCDCPPDKPVLKEDVCVAVEDCGCADGLGNYFPIGHTLYDDDCAWYQTCQVCTECTFPVGIFVRTEVGCRGTQTCHKVNGIPTCIEVIERNPVLVDNGYHGLVVAISDCLREEDNINLIDNIKALFSEFSSSIFTATRGKAYIKEVTILVPPSWSVDKNATHETYHHADFRIDRPLTLYGDRPFTYPGLEATPQCGVGWEYTQLTPDYIKSALRTECKVSCEEGDFGTFPSCKGCHYFLNCGWGSGQHLECFDGTVYDHNTGNCELYSETCGASGLIHEWGHLRWGLGNEGPEVGSTERWVHLQTPHCDPQKGEHPDGVGGCYLPVKCSEGLQFEDPNLNGTCNPGNPNEQEGCIFEPKVEEDKWGWREHNIASIMFANSDYNIPSVAQFCDDAEDTQHGLKHSLVQNQHNQICNFQSAWGVMRKHADFKNGTKPLTHVPEETTQPYFHILKRPSEIRVALAVETSSKLTTFQMGNIQRLINRYIDGLPDGSYAAVVTFADTATVQENLILVDSNRDLLKGSVPRALSGKPCIGCAINEALNLLRMGGQFQFRGRLFLITSGEDAVSPTLQDVMWQTRTTGVEIDTLQFGDQPNLDLEELATGSGGSYYLDSGFRNFFPMSEFALGTIITRFAPCTHTGRIAVQALPISLHASRSVDTTIYLDKALGDQTQFSWYIPDTVVDTDFTITLVRPDQTTVPSNDVVYLPEIGVLSYSEPGVAQHGTWSLEIECDHPAEIEFMVTSHPRDDNYVQAKASIIGNNIDIQGESAANKVVRLYVQVRHGSLPVLNVDVKATVESSHERYRVALLDNGLGADTVADDGTYSAYFTKYPRDGQYTVFATASNKDGSAHVQEARRSKRNAAQSSISQFQRFVHIGYFSVVNHPTNDGRLPNVAPPAKVRDLVVVSTSLEKGTIELGWTAVGASMTDGIASRYEIRYHGDMLTLFRDFSAGTLVHESDVKCGDIDNPRPSGSRETITLKISHELTDNVLYFALRVFDSSNLESETSNIATASMPPSDETDDRYRIIIILTSVNMLLILIIISIVVGILVWCCCKNKSSDNKVHPTPASTPEVTSSTVELLVDDQSEYEKRPITPPERIPTQTSFAWSWQSKKK